MDSEIQALVTKQAQSINAEIRSLYEEYEKLSYAMLNHPVPEDPSNITGRRIMHTLVVQRDMTLHPVGESLEIPMVVEVGRDGPFVLTHEPFIVFKNPTRWQPVSSWTLPTQNVAASTVDISFRLADSGAERKFDNETALNTTATPAGVLSRPGMNFNQLPTPTVFAVNSAINLRITYNSQNLLQVRSAIIVAVFPGYKIVNR